MSFGSKRTKPAIPIAFAGVPPALIQGVESGRIPESPGHSGRKSPVSAEPASETELLSRARNHDRAAFAELVLRYQSSLEALLRGYVKDHDRANELAQEAIYKAFVNLDRYSDEHRFSTWFFRIGINLAISAHRKRRREVQPGEEAMESKTPASEGSLLDQAVKNEEISLLQRAIGSLPERYRDILKMRFQDGLECKEIARRLGSSPNTVSMVLFRAKDRLRQELDLP